MIKEITLPEISDGVESGTIAEVLVKKGDKVEEEDAVIVVESDKASVEVPSEVAGTVEEVAVSEGDEIGTGELILKLETNGKEGGEESSSEKEEDTEKEKDAGQEEAKQEASEKKEEASKAEEDSSEEEEEVKEGKVEVEDKQAQKKEGKTQQNGKQQSGKKPQDIPAAPSARRLARELDVDIANVEGTGPSGRILADDVKAAAEEPQKQEKKEKGQEKDFKELVNEAGRPIQPSLPDFEKWGSVSREPLNAIKKATAQNISQSWQTIPQVTHADKADVTELEKQLEAFQEKAKKQDVKVTMTAVLMNVMALALRKFPRFNASIDVENNEAIYKHFINIGVAVDTPEGLLVPVIQNADQKTVLDLATELNEKAKKAREKKLEKAEMEGGTFSISNLGGIGGQHFTPIVYHPQVAILGVSRTEVAPVWNDGEWTPRSMLPLSLSYDHRLIDGAEAARFLRWTCQVMEDPFSLLLG